MTTKVNIGIVRISPELLLAIFDFRGGAVKDAKFNYPFIDFYIEHPDMPLVEEGTAIPVVSPSYIRYEDAQGHWVALRERVK